MYYVQALKPTNVMRHSTQIKYAAGADLLREQLINWNIVVFKLYQYSRKNVCAHIYTKFEPESPTGPSDNRRIWRETVVLDGCNDCRKSKTVQTVTFAQIWIWWHLVLFVMIPCLFNTEDNFIP